MKRGDYSLANYMVFFIAAMIIITGPIMTVKYETSSRFAEQVQEKGRVQTYIFTRSLTDCLSMQDLSGKYSFDRVDIQQFTDEKISSCTSEPVVALLQLPDKSTTSIISTDPSLKQYTSLHIIRQESVLVDNQRAVLSLGVKNA